MQFLDHALSPYLGSSETVNCFPEGLYHLSVRFDVHMIQFLSFPSSSELDAAVSFGFPERGNRQKGG